MFAPWWSHNPSRVTRGSDYWQRIWHLDVRDVAQSSHVPLTILRHWEGKKTVISISDPLDSRKIFPCCNKEYFSFNTIWSASLNLRMLKARFFFRKERTRLCANLLIIVIRPSQFNVSFPIALPLVRVGRSFGQKKRKKGTNTWKGLVNFLTEMISHCHIRSIWRILIHFSFYTNFGNSNVSLISIYLKLQLVFLKSLMRV